MTPEEKPVSERSLCMLRTQWARIGVKPTGNRAKLMASHRAAGKTATEHA